MKKNSIVALATCLLISSASGQGLKATSASATKPTTKRENVQSVSPALENYTETRLLGEVWKRPDLSLPDRSVITVAALIARNQTAEMSYYFNLALDNVVKPGELLSSANVN